MPQNFSLQLKSSLMIIEKDMKLTVHNPKSFAQEAPFWIPAKCQGKIDHSTLPEQDLKKGQGCQAKEGHTQKGQVLKGYAQEGHAQESHVQKGQAQEGHAQKGLVQEGYVHEGQIIEGYAQEGHAKKGLVQEGYAHEGHSPKDHAQESFDEEGLADLVEENLPYEAEDTFMSNDKICLKILEEIVSEMPIDNKSEKGTAKYLPSEPKELQSKVVPQTFGGIFDRLIASSISQPTTVDYGNTGCRVFKQGGKKLERFLTKNQHTQRKSLNCYNGEMSKGAKI